MTAIRPALFACLLVTADLLAIPRPGHAQDRCEAVVGQVADDIQARLGAVIADFKIARAADFMGDASYRSPFADADGIVVFFLASDMGRGSTTRQQAQAAENIMNSPGLTRAYAQAIIAACAPVASVKFHFWEGFQGWSLRPGGVLVEDVCKDERDLRWGENFCV